MLFGVAQHNMHPVLLGNSFPLSLIRRTVRIDPRPLEELRQAVGDRGCVSFWGHANTLEVAKQFLGFDPTPATARPALTLNGEGFPVYAGNLFQEIWVLSPDYRAGFRPKIGHEVAPGQILSWQVLRLEFSDI